MNFLGKCFVVALFVMSCAFMGAAIAAYGAHRDLQAEKQKLSETLRQKQSDLTTLQGQYNRLESELTAEAEAARARAQQLETEKVRLADRNAQAQLALDELRAQNGELAAAMNATQQNNDALASELTTLRSSIRTALADKDRYFGAALAATEKLQSVRNEIETTAERNRDLLADASRMTSLLRSNNLDPETPVEEITPRVDGFVSRTQRKDGVMLVEISIGSDDGLRPGQTVEVFRDTKYKGRIEILKTSGDRAVGRVDVRFQQGPIQEGDRVATRLKLS
ncbi:hypothetical protein [Botrimarina hoheduenensis]|uniref:Chromosome partition protein Smc n=1 Tax=Botrimarina hoheduenensis TaxID=2528000 RepID=A0A5C5W8N4_9BACT|nr:hypothetical protein [Botrimarina hoheduenensis]TWT47256.1 Chromosome partition protein Smc [Botrimarina hoheduenensis]